jgi:hypothetical protein
LVIYDKRQTTNDQPVTVLVAAMPRYAQALPTASLKKFGKKSKILFVGVVKDISLGKLLLSLSGKPAHF